jgi:Na+-transporting methylmalonyl-CoA/oxaloacetate decarboxylase beta subunit
LRECLVVERLSNAAQNELMNIVTLILGITVGSTMTAEVFLDWDVIKIFALGAFAFLIATAGGVLLGKLMYWISRGKVNPIIGAAGVSAVPMAARVCQKEAQREDPDNFILMHAMGPNVAGVIGTAIAAGVLISLVPEMIAVP